MAKVYRVTAIAYDEETGEEEELLDNEYTGFTLLGSEEDGYSETVMFHENIKNLAVKLALNKETKIASRLATVYADIQDGHISDMEDTLKDMIGG